MSRPKECPLFVAAVIAFPGEIGDAARAVRCQGSRCGWWRRQTCEEGHCGAISVSNNFDAYSDPAREEPPVDGADDR